MKKYINQFDRIVVEHNNTPILAKEGSVIFFKYSKFSTQILTKALSMISDIQQYLPKDGDIVAEKENNQFMILNADKHRTLQELEIVFRDVEEYAQRYVKKYFNGEIIAPNPFNCWSCYYSIHCGSQHLWVHVYKPDYPGALLVSSIKQNNFCLLEPHEKQNYEFGKLYPSSLLIDNLSQFICRKLSMPM